MSQIDFLNVDNKIWMPDIPDKAYHLAIVDPPYGIDIDGGIGGGVLAKASSFEKKHWDKQAPDGEYFSQLFRISKHQIIFGANHYISKIPIDSSCWIVWDKMNGDNNFADCELAWTSFDTAVRIFRWRWQGMLQGNMKNKQQKIHPTEKPYELYRWILQNYAEPGWKILDTHGGSMSHAIAADMEGFDLTIMEKDKEYFDDAVKRFKQYKSQLTLFNQ